MCRFRVCVGLCVCELAREILRDYDERRSTTLSNANRAAAPFTTPSAASFIFYLQWFRCRKCTHCRGLRVACINIVWARFVSALVITILKMYNSQFRVEPCTIHILLAPLITTHTWLFSVRRGAVCLSRMVFVLALVDTRFGYTCVTLF